MNALDLVPILKIGGIGLTIIAVIITLWRYGHNCYKNGFESGFKLGYDKWQKEKEEFYQRIKNLVQGKAVIIAKKQGTIKDDKDD